MPCACPPKFSPTEGVVHRLDDDSPPWEGFVGLAEMLGVWIRQFEGLHAEVAGQLGRRLRGQVLRKFQDPRATFVLAEYLRGVPAMTERHESARDACVAAIAPPTRRGAHPPQPRSHCRRTSTPTSRRSRPCWRLCAGAM